MKMLTCTFPKMTTVPIEEPHTAHMAEIQRMSRLDTEPLSRFADEIELRPDTTTTIPMDSSCPSQDSAHTRHSHLDWPAHRIPPRKSSHLKEILN